MSSATLARCVPTTRMGASGACACSNLPIDPLCGLMAFPPSGLPTALQEPKLCAAQAKNASVACEGYLCSTTTCAV